MDDSIDPIAQFFPDDPTISLYTVLSIDSTASANEIKSAYRKLALVHHPDKHASASEEAQKAAALRFQQVGFAYAVLGDEKRRKKYDETGDAREGADWEGRDEEGWTMYFEQMFEKVTRGKLDEMKKAYQGSDEEIEDLKAAYAETEGDIEGIISHIPHSNYTDEARFVEIIKGLIEAGELESTAAWKKGLKDAKGRATRKKKGEKEAKEAEEAAKELGVWDEFYGSGKEGNRKTKGKGKGKKDDGDDGEDALKALIQARGKQRLDGFMDSLAAKYGAAEEGPSKGKKRGRGAAAAEEPPEIDEEEFQRIQSGLKKRKSEEKSPSKVKAGKSKGRKGK
ncbi:hypothetical protein M422DRAFT_779483 [Sphaerobolus stellatus SS14]|uniref:J domain-containing protein n=1 Tax=Sphaerobolus stellatus (strain SS14) TaxID=990650 RepID=A0A0C9VQ78_SPHS4|nr:hypothetical protein M422DRAFT_779483 [Sphaerobolus stellatus SS14]